MRELSILIPEYNCICTKLVYDLYNQCISINSLLWEIIVADDGSTDSEIIKQNRSINKLSHCVFIEKNATLADRLYEIFLHPKRHLIGFYLLTLICT